MINDEEVSDQEFAERLRRDFELLRMAVELMSKTLVRKSPVEKKKQDEVVVLMTYNELMEIKAAESKAKWDAIKKKRREAKEAKAKELNEDRSADPSQ